MSIAPRGWKPVELCLSFRCASFTAKATLMKTRRNLHLWCIRTLSPVSRCWPQLCSNLVRNAKCFRCQTSTDHANWILRIVHANWILRMVTHYFCDLLQDSLISLLGWTISVLLPATNVDRFIRKISLFLNKTFSTFRGDSSSSNEPTRASFSFHSLQLHSYNQIPIN